MLHVRWHLVLWWFLSNWNVKFHCHLCPSFSAVSFVGCHQVCCCRKYSIITGRYNAVLLLDICGEGLRRSLQTKGDSWHFSLGSHLVLFPNHCPRYFTMTPSVSMSRQLSSDKGQVFLCISIHFLPLMQVTLTQTFSKLFLATFSDSFYAQILL